MHIFIVLDLLYLLHVFVLVKLYIYIKINQFRYIR